MCYKYIEMAKTVNLEYNSIGSAFGILITIMFCFIIVYFGCMVLEKGDEIVPQPIQYIYRYFFVKPFQSDFDYLYGTSDRYLEISSTSVSMPSPSPMEQVPVEEAPMEQVPVEQVPTDMSKCPTKLIKKGKQLMLINENMPAIQGSNPIYFDSLDDYVYYAQVQRAQTGQKCPILYLKEDEPIVEDKPDLSKIDVISQYFKTQQLPQDLAKTRQSAMNVPYQPYQQAQFYNYPLPPAATLALANAPVLALPQAQQRPMVPYLDANQKLNSSGQQYGFDPTSQFVGKYTILDKIHASTKTQFPSGFSANAMDSNWGGAIFTSNKLREGEYAGDEVLPEKAIVTPQQGAIPQQQQVAIPQQQQVAIPQQQQVAIPQQQQQGAIPQQQGASTNPMDPNWGGKAYTENAVKSGEFDGNIVTMRPA